MNTLYSIHAGKNIFSVVPALGALGVSLKLPVQGEMQELLYLPADFWQRADKVFQGGMPFCFPICGRLTQGNIPLHGFAARMPWSVEKHTEDRLTLLLKDTAETQAVYPYAFEVRLHYRITETEFECSFECKNLSDEPMPYYAGFHPYFAAALEYKNRVSLELNAQKRFYYNAALNDVVRESIAAPFHLPIEALALDQVLYSAHHPLQCALHFPKDYALSLRLIDSRPLFCYIQLYTEKDKPFFCVEPWMNQPNAYNKPSLLHYLNPGAVDHASLILAVRAE